MASSSCRRCLSTSRRSLVTGILQQTIGLESSPWISTPAASVTKNHGLLTTSAATASPQCCFYSTNRTTDLKAARPCRRAASAVAAVVEEEDSGTDNESDNDDQEKALPPPSSLPPSDLDFDPQGLILDVYEASRFLPKKEWNPNHILSVIDSYERHLHYIQHGMQFSKSLESFVPDADMRKATLELLSSTTTERAFVMVTKAKLHTPLLSEKVRTWERCIGIIGLTEITPNLSFQLLHANSKAGNVGRVVALLQWRLDQECEVQPNEYELAVLSIEAAGLFLRTGRNIFINDAMQPQLDNPTRWLDAILDNMKQRGVPLTTRLANRMLNTFATSGKSGKAVHFFYKVKQHAIDEDCEHDDDLPKFQNGSSMHVGLRYNAPPPFHKVPSQAKGKVFADGSSNSNEGRRVSKLERELQSDWSVPTHAAFSFCDSLTLGACGHDPIALDLCSYNALIKTCCYRGSLWRAMEILNKTLPKAGLEPDVYTYNTILFGLARVGDVETQQELFLQMSNSRIMDKLSVQGLVEGFLNVGRVADAVSLVQDIFNQHQVLPPYTTHLQLLEMALSYNLVHEAKRHVYFIQQLWKWTPPSAKSDPELEKVMRLTQKNPKLSKEALMRLFAYFGHSLEEQDFI